MPWLLDGNNLARGKARESVRRAALAVARHERVRILLFFDGAPPGGSAEVEMLGTVEVRYVPHADTAIAAFIRGKGRGWRVATDDRGLQGRVRAAGAEVVPARAFWEKAATADEAAKRSDVSRGVGEDLESLRVAVCRLPQGAARIPRRRRRHRGG